MPKLKESPEQRMRRVFKATVRYGMNMRGEEVADIVKMSGQSRATAYKRIRDATTCTGEEMLFYVPRYFNDRQLCALFGVPYRGTTPMLGEEETA